MAEGKNHNLRGSKHVSHKPTKFALICIFLMSVAGVQAATITATVDNVTNPGGNIGLGDEVKVTVVGRDFLAGAGGSIGGGFSLLWDPAVVTLQSYLVTFPGTTRFGAPGVLDILGGSLMNEDVTHFFGTASPDFDVAEFTFQAVALGESLLDLAIGNFAFPMVWADSDGFTDANPEFVDGRIVVTPIPAAIWLFGSVIGIAAWIRRRRGQVS